MGSIKQNGPAVLGAAMGLLTAIGPLLLVFTDLSEDQVAAILGVGAAVLTLLGTLLGLAVQKKVTYPREDLVTQDDGRPLTNEEVEEFFRLVEEEG